MTETDYPGCLACGKPFPPDARIDRRYCNKRCNNRHYSQVRRGKATAVPRPNAATLLGAMTPQQLGWVAGIVEGEGSISCHPVTRHGNTYTYAEITVSMTDEDIIRRLGEWTQVGRVSGPHCPPSRGDNRPHWNWNVTSWADTQAVINTLWPLLGSRRREQAENVRQRMAERTLKRWPILQ